MIAVLGIMAMIMIISVTLASSTLYSLQYTNATRAGVQAQAAAEAGIDFAAAKMGKAACSTPYIEASPQFEVEVLYLPATGGDFKPGCPVPGALSVKLRSEGYPDVEVLGNGTGNVRVVEAIYAAPAAATPQAGAAVYAYNSSGFAGSGILTPGGDVAPSVGIRHGDVTCDGDSSLAGNLTVADGSLTVSGSCKVGGNVWASNSLKMSGGAVAGGDATGASVSLQSSKVGGNAWASGAMSLTWGTTVGGNATAAVLGLDGGNVKGGAWSAGAATFISSGAYIDGFLTAKSTNYAGNARGGSKILPSGPGAGPAAGTTPLVPNWIDYKYSKGDWAGFTEELITGVCDFAKLKDAAAKLASGPGIINALGCDGAVSIAGSDKLALGDNLAIIAKGFNLSGGGGFSATDKRTLWLITPDSVADANPTCPGSTPAVGPFTVDGGFILDSKIKAMVYSPCKVTISSGISWYGQVFSGNVTIDGAAKLYFFPVGLPGVDISTGTIAVPGASTMLGARTSIRDANG